MALREWLPPQNIPAGHSYYGASWRDHSGNLWFFGGASTPSGGVYLLSNDLWRFNPSTLEWTWMGGYSSGNAHGVYGTLGKPGPLNFPGSRYFADGWTDNSGNLWLFGGFGYPEEGATGYLNDVWKFDISSGEWAWMGGSKTVPASCPSPYQNQTQCGQSGIYGTRRQAAATNLPGGRCQSTSWTDASGNFWLFGGFGFDSAGTLGGLNDLWKFNVTSKEWTWIDGSSVFGPEVALPGVYGQLGVPAAANTPGGRGGPANWIDINGNLWLFGGDGFVSFDDGGPLNDLWEFSPSTLEWTWMGGADEPNQLGNYGQLGQSNAANLPGGRFLAANWTDLGGNFWIFGGIGYGSSGTIGVLNDLWEYKLATKQWVWMSGSESINEPGSYSAVGVPAAANLPSARGAAISWSDLYGNLWLFGGAGYDSEGQSASLNDLWLYALNVNFSQGFSQAKERMQVNGSAHLDGSPALRLTHGETHEGGSAFYSEKVSVQAFTTDFVLQLVDPSADGMTFTIQNNTPTAIGGAGGSLAYTGIGNSVAIKFDIYNNEGEGPNSTGLYVDGALPEAPAISLAGTGIDLHSGDSFRAHITYDGVQLILTLVDEHTLAKWSHSFAINIPATVGGPNAYVGFTGATGALTSSAEILSWTYVAGPPPAS